VSFGTGPALQTYDYSVKCVEESLVGDKVLDGCDLFPAGDGPVAGQTTKAISTINAEVTGLTPLVEYQCYINVVSDKGYKKCMPVVTPVIPFPDDIEINMSAINNAMNGQNVRY
jgi:hypothetical protein